jgi:hypothetical protein
MFKIEGASLLGSDQVHLRRHPSRLQRVEAGVLGGGACGSYYRNCERAALHLIAR